MIDAELYMNPDHTVWAREFCRVAREIGFDPANSEHESWVGSWIANAMMHGDDRVTGNWPVRLPDGSGFAVG